MTTLRQIERLWQTQSCERMVRVLLETRYEASLRLVMDLARPAPAAAIAVIRLEELGQAYLPLSARLIRAIVELQEQDGGWGDVMATAICLRALMCSNGQGAAVERGLSYLAALQKTEGIWPRIPVRRTDSDAFVSAFILYQLAGDSRFHQAVRMPEALAWFKSHQRELDLETAHLWHGVSGRASSPGRMAMATADASPEN